MNEPTEDMVIVKTIKVDKDNPEITQGPFLRSGLGGKGCNLPGCNCSPGHWITVSNGDVILKVQVTPDQAKRILKGDTITLTGKKAKAKLSKP